MNYIFNLNLYTSLILFEVYVSFWKCRVNICGGFWGLNVLSPLKTFPSAEFLITWDVLSYFCMVYCWLQGEQAWKQTHIYMIDNWQGSSKLIIFSYIYEGVCVYECIHILSLEVLQICLTEEMKDVYSVYNIKMNWLFGRGWLVFLICLKLNFFK